MTAVPRAAVRERLTEAVGTAIDLNRRLEEIIAVPTSKIPRSGRQGRIDHSQPPWNASVAHLITDLFALARSLEAQLRHYLGMAQHFRGDTDENTVFALKAIVNLAEAADNDATSGILYDIDRWNGRALIVLGDRELPQRLPRDVGEPERPCPYCDYPTLRFWPTRAEVRCVNPACLDETEHRPVARIEYSIVAREWVLAWRDGFVGVPAPKDQRTTS